MIHSLYFAGLLITAYLLGSIPFGFLIARSHGIDIRKHGSGNIGATNTFRVLGKKWGLLVFILDAAKGCFAVLLAQWFLGHHVSDILKIVIGICAIAGHTFPLWLSFRGGKGVATTLGVFLNIIPVPTLIAVLIWFIVFLLTRIISVASIFYCLFKLFPLIIRIKSNRIFKILYRI